VIGCTVCRVVLVGAVVLAGSTAGVVVTHGAMGSVDENEVVDVLL